MSGASAGHAHREKHVCYRQPLQVALAKKNLQEQEWIARTVLRPILYVPKQLSDTKMKYGAPKTEMFAVVMFIEKYRSYLRSAPFKLRSDRRALYLLKMY